MLQCVRCGECVSHTFDTECYKCFGTSFTDDFLREEINFLADSLRGDVITYYAEELEHWEIDLSKSIDCVYIIEEHDFMYG